MTEYVRVSVGDLTNGHLGASVRVQRPKFQPDAGAWVEGTLAAMRPGVALRDGMYQECVVLVVEVATSAADAPGVVPRVERVGPFIAADSIDLQRRSRLDGEGSRELA